MRLAPLIRRHFTTSANKEINFLKEASSTLRSASHHKRDMEDQYSSDNHSLLPYLYMYRSLQDNIGYLLLEPRTRKLILIDAGDFEASSKVVKEIEF